MKTNVLLLQGPMGPFFRYFSETLKQDGDEVFKINLNAGDKYFYPKNNAYSFVGDISEWQTYLANKLVYLNIGRIYLFGDTRIYHKIARKIATELGIKVFVFEEGYLRPHYITLEEGGVNGNSTIPQDGNLFSEYPARKEKMPEPIPFPFLQTVMVVITYFIAAWLGRKKFPNYRHHRSLNPWTEGCVWVLSAIRKVWCKIEQAGIQQVLTGAQSKNYYLVALQVHNDAQIKEWSNMASVANFIRRVVKSFAKNAPSDSLLVIKHHPLDRGYRNYARLINKLAKKYDCSERIYYIHDLHLPTLLDHAKGTVLINSTVGLSSLLHNTPVITLGHAIYDMAGLTFQGQLSDFWNADMTVDQELNNRFRQYLLRNNQINTNFYTRVSNIKVALTTHNTKLNEIISIRKSQTNVIEQH